MNLAVLYPSVVAAVLAAVLVLAVRAARAEPDSSARAHLTSPLALGAQVFITGWTALSALTWAANGSSAWWVWAVAAALSLGVLTVQVRHHRRDTGRSAVDSTNRQDSVARPRTAFTLAVAGGVSLLAGNVLRGFAGSPSSEEMRLVDAAYIALVAISLILLVSAGFAAFRQSMRDQEHQAD
ncbi:hypothetical protein [Serinicoccus marinus]|uniref:hypothetical protein n=1 Tax=Serinicoccus marinus TaxID=247333 RepID=UPI00248FB3E4|nr:hypothetical protein [Serinicoccus marinus]